MGAYQTKQTDLDTNYDSFVAKHNFERVLFRDKYRAPALKNSGIKRDQFYGGSSNDYLNLKRYNQYNPELLLNQLVKNSQNLQEINHIGGNKNNDDILVSDRDYADLEYDYSSVIKKLGGLEGGSKKFDYLNFVREQHIIDQSGGGCGCGNNDNQKNKQTPSIQSGGKQTTQSDKYNFNLSNFSATSEISYDPHISKILPSETSAQPVDFSGGKRHKTKSKKKIKNNDGDEPYDEENDQEFEYGKLNQNLGVSSPVSDDNNETRNFYSSSEAGTHFFGRRNY